MDRLAIKSVAKNEFCQISYTYVHMLIIAPSMMLGQNLVEDVR